MNEMMFSDAAMETSKTTCYVSQLLHLLDEQRQTGMLCDVTVASNDSMVFNAHSAILAASSEIFSSKLSGQNVGQVMLDLEGRSIKMLLDVLYTGISTLEPEEVIDVRLLAQSFEMLDIIKLCDGVIEYDLPSVAKPGTMMIDQSTNTESTLKVKVVEPDPEPDDDDDELEEKSDMLLEEKSDARDDPEYQPNMDKIKSGVYIGRKRGRPPGSGRKKGKIEVSNVKEASMHLFSHDIDNNDCGPKTRSRSGISKLKPAFQNILTRVRDSESRTKVSPAIKITPVKKGGEEVTNVRMKSGTVAAENVRQIEDTLVIEDGDVDDSLVDDSYRSIMSYIEHLNAEEEVETLDTDSEQFQNLVSKSLSEILTGISKKNETAHSSTGESDVKNEWKKCRYCSQFKGRKKGRLDFHRKFCSSRHKCSLCHKPFLSEYDLSRHRCSKIQQERICEHCGKVLVNKNALKLHMKIHLDIKNHACHLCGKRFIRKVHLDGHVRAVHTKERPYHCSQCNAKFSWKGELNRHMLKHSTGLPKYACSFCGKSFYERRVLTSHFKVCRVKQPLQLTCSKCNAIFNDETHLLSHSNVCQMENMVTHYIEQKRTPDGSVILHILPGDTAETTIGAEQRVIQIDGADPVAIEDVLQNAQHFVQGTEIHDVGDQVFQLQTVENDDGFQQLTSMQDLQTLNLQGLISEKMEGVQIIQSVSVDGQEQILQSIPLDGQTQNFHVLQPPKDCDDSNIMTVDAVPTIQDENSYNIQIQGGHIYTQI